MAKIYTSNTSNQISFDEFIKTISKTIIYDNEESLLDCVTPLFKLSNNSNFLVEYLNKELEGNIDNFQINNPYSEQSILMYDCDNFYVRITYWPLIENKNPIINEAQNELFAYGMAHDHNFSLLTAGYKGDGYRTKLWEYNHNNVIGYINEKVDIKFLEEITLKKDTAIYYRPSKDIHYQMPPLSQSSLAINIIMKSKTTILKKQYEFDIDNHSIKSIFDKNVVSGLINLSTFINNSKTKELLLKLGTYNKVTPQIRRTSLNALYKIEKSKEVLKIGLRDKNKSNFEYFQFLIQNI